jgi:hypothetical protein
VQKGARNDTEKDDITQLCNAINADLESEKHVRFMLI